MSPELYNQKELHEGRLTWPMITRLVQYWQGEMGLAVDGLAGPQTQVSLMGAVSASPYGAEVVAVLRSWLGQGEELGNNRSPFIQKLMHGAIGAWCAALQYNADEVALQKLGLQHPVPFDPSVFVARTLLRKYREVGKEISPLEVAVGDLVVFPRGLPWQGHAARASAVLSPGKVNLIDGNVGSFKDTQGVVREYGPVDLVSVPIVGIARLVGV